MYVAVLERGPSIAVAIWGGLTFGFFGLFWNGLRNASIDCNFNATPKTNNQNGITCAVDVIQTAVSGVLTGITFVAGLTALFAPTPRDLNGELHPMLQSGVYTHVGYREADADGYHRLYYLNNPEKPSKVRMNLADRGVHESEINSTHALIYHATKKRQVEEEWWVDVNTGNIGIEDYFPQSWAIPNTSAVQATTSMLTFMAENSLNSTCFLVETPTHSPYKASVIMGIGPSQLNSTADSDQALDCPNLTSSTGVKIQ